MSLRAEITAEVLALKRLLHCTRILDKLLHSLKYAMLKCTMVKLHFCQVPYTKARRTIARRQQRADKNAQTKSRRQMRADKCAQLEKVRMSF